MWTLLASVACAAVATTLVVRPLEADPRVSFGHARAVRKGVLRPAVGPRAATAPLPGPVSSPDDDATNAAASPLLATLVDVHFGDHVPLAASEPPNARFDDLLADRTTGERHALDPRLLVLLRDLAA